MKPMNLAYSHELMPHNKSWNSNIQALSIDTELKSLFLFVIIWLSIKRWMNIKFVAIFIRIQIPYLRKTSSHKI